jgi:hypothetical protein
VLPSRKCLSFEKALSRGRSTLTLKKQQAGKDRVPRVVQISLHTVMTGGIQPGKFHKTFIYFGINIEKQTVKDIQFHPRHLTLPTAGKNS